jgi:small subunit ribosomal protein S3
MEEKQTVKFKKEEFAIKEIIRKNIGKGKMSKVRIEYTPVGEKVIISTDKPGLVIGRGGESLNELSNMLKKNFKFQNLHIEIEEIKEPEFDAQTIADEIALGLERFGPLKFKVIAYRTLEKVMKSGALGCEIRLGGKLPSSRAKSWRFAQGWLKKTGDSAKVVSRAQARAETKPGTVGVKVSILSPHAIMKDRIKIDNKLINNLKENANKINIPIDKKTKKLTGKNKK